MGGGPEVCESIRREEARIRGVMKEPNRTASERDCVKIIAVPTSELMCRALWMASVYVCECVRVFLHVCVVVCQ